jgi:hypothetical protein
MTSLATKSSLWLYKGAGGQDSSFRVSGSGTAIVGGVAGDRLHHAGLMWPSSMQRPWVPSRCRRPRSPASVSGHHGWLQLQPALLLLHLQARFHHHPCVRLQKLDGLVDVGARELDWRRCTACRLEPSTRPTFLPPRTIAERHPCLGLAASHLRLLLPVFIDMVLPLERYTSFI